MIDQREEWLDWPSRRQDPERLVLMREIFYQMTSLIGSGDAHNGDRAAGQLAKALSLNISSGGMLLLMDYTPELERGVRVHVPSPVLNAYIPTLAEVRWVRKIPLGQWDNLWLVGLRFLL